MRYELSMTKMINGVGRSDFEKTVKKLAAWYVLQGRKNDRFFDREKIITCIVGCSNTK